MEIILIFLIILFVVVGVIGEDTTGKTKNAPTEIEPEKKTDDNGFIVHLETPLLYWQKGNVSEVRSLQFFRGEKRVRLEVANGVSYAVLLIADSGGGGFALRIKETPEEVASILKAMKNC